MARRKRYEFRPDKVNDDILGKLLLTKKQFHALIRWLLLSIVCLLALIVQDTVMSRIKIFDATTDLVPVIIMTVCVLQGAQSSCIFVLAASVFYHFSGSAPGVYCIVLITFISVLVAVFRQAFLIKGFSALMLCCAIGMLLYEGGVFGIALFLNQTISQRYPIFLLTTAMSLVCVPLLYPVLKAIGRIGGETWKE